MHRDRQRFLVLISAGFLILAWQFWPTVARDPLDAFEAPAIAPTALDVLARTMGATPLWTGLDGPDDVYCLGVCEWAGGDDCTPSCTLRTSPTEGCLKAACWIVFRPRAKAGQGDIVTATAAISVSPASDCTAATGALVADLLRTEGNLRLGR